MIVVAVETIVETVVVVTLIDVVVQRGRGNLAEQYDTAAGKSDRGRKAE